MFKSTLKNLCEAFRTSASCALWYSLLIFSAMHLVKVDVALGEEDTKTLYSVLGSEYAANLGHSVSGVGDVNRDGIRDFIAGAPGATNPSGALLAGSASLVSGADGSVIRTFWGDASEDRLGYSVAGAGDVNGDGVPDIVVGISGADRNGLNSGSARVFSGKDGALLHEFFGDNTGWEFGFAVSGAGDVDGDGFSDVIVGAPFSEVGRISQAGTVRVFSGKSGDTLFNLNGSALDDMFGYSVGSVGDVNKDGFADFVATTRYGDNNGQDAGRVTVFSGKGGTILYNFTGPSAFSRFGSTAAGAGDINGDEFDDIIIGSDEYSPNGRTQAGRVQIFSGRDGTVLRTFDGSNSWDYFGFSVAGTGDINGDGVRDVIIGSRWKADGAGQAKIFSGSSGQLLYTFDGAYYSGVNRGEALGFAVADAGDVNGDGYGEVIIGAPYHGQPSSNLELAGRSSVIGDGCPNDSAKGAPGLCGCGVADSDADNDGTPDCNDQCPSDTGKVAPGQCGCGVADTDTDKDRTLDCNDQCPKDANKVAPGQCGCGVADTDTDGDFTLDCNDQCPSDSNKIAPGQCGCGAADTDSDKDGTPDCTDQCLSDANKVAPGQCGCGLTDVDSDKDGVPDCKDQCSSDANKVAPGQCGCGVADMDSDKDGTPDCTDQCLSDASKVAPGQCGCGAADTDSDKDGTPDCTDQCLSDANKVAPGQCGCGLTDVDSDKDGVPDCKDQCSSDANKVAPGQCGCGVADTDSDNDGTPDCTDQCLSDASKVAPGQCGCGVADTDSDNDGTPDCTDQCLSDASKIAPGQCGCEVADEDLDGDGTADCNDKCPEDPSKINGCDLSGITDSTPTPTPSPTTNLLDAPRVKAGKGSVQVWVVGKFARKDRITFTITGPKSKTLRGKRLRSSKRATARFQASFMKLPKGTYQASWQVLRAGAAPQQSSTKIFRVR